MAYPPLEHAALQSTGAVPLAPPAFSWPALHAPPFACVAPPVSLASCGGVLAPLENLVSVRHCKCPPARPFAPTRRRFLLSPSLMMVKSLTSSSSITRILFLAFSLLAPNRNWPLLPRAPDRVCDTSCVGAPLRENAGTDTSSERRITPIAPNPRPSVCTPCVRSSALEADADTEFPVTCQPRRTQAMLAPHLQWMARHPSSAARDKTTARSGSVTSRSPVGGHDLVALPTEQNH